MKITHQSHPQKHANWLVTWDLPEQNGLTAGVAPGHMARGVDQRSCKRRCTSHCQQSRPPSFPHQGHWDAHERRNFASLRKGKLPQHLHRSLQHPPVSMASTTSLHLSDTTSSGHVFSSWRACSNTIPSRSAACGWASPLCGQHPTKSGIDRQLRPSMTSKVLARTSILLASSAATCTFMSFMKTFCRYWHLLRGKCDPPHVQLGERPLLHSATSGARRSFRRSALGVYG